MHRRVVVSITVFKRQSSTKATQNKQFLSQRKGGEEPLRAFYHMSVIGAIYTYSVVVGVSEEAPRSLGAGWFDNRRRLAVAVLLARW